ncbi:MAG: metallophosphoesterase [Rhizobiales bacterium]|nr:metallophosphoesterase [Hyphomicrobiales bacterium]
MTNFRLAHFSDIHMPPMPKPTLLELTGIRILGLTSWAISRKKIHMQNVFRAFEKDIKQQEIDHYAFSGDLVNIGSRAEIKRSTAWMRGFAPADKMSYVPGNHDAYTEDSIASILHHWSDYMTCCDQGAEILKTLNIELTNAVPFGPFPYIRIFGRVALIGISSAYASPPFMATGEMGEAQRSRLKTILAYLKKEGFFRVAMIHHPPLPRLTPSVRALKDCAELKDILTDIGAELVIYGHNHKNKITNIDNKFGPTLCIGVSSASAVATSHKPAASYNQILIDESKKGWQVNLLKREYIAEQNNFVETEVTPLGFWHF